MIDWPSGPSTIHSVGTIRAATDVFRGRPAGTRSGRSPRADASRLARTWHSRPAAGRPGLPGGQVRDQQGTGRRRHHRRHHRHQPATEGDVRAVTRAGDTSGRAPRRRRPARRWCQPSTGSSRRPTQPTAEDVAAEQQRAGADGHHRHRRRSVEECPSPGSQRVHGRGRAVYAANAAAVATVRPTSSIAASAQTTVANARSPANCSGSDAAATATIPVPMTTRTSSG